MEERTKWDGKGKALCVLQVSHVKKKKKGKKIKKCYTALRSSPSTLKTISGKTD